MEYTHPVHEPTPLGKQFLAELSDADKRLHALAQRKLGSSYFVEKTPQFIKWKAARTAAAAAAVEKKN